MWARIWCVRPVSSRTRAASCAAVPRAISKWVTRRARLSVRDGHHVAPRAVAADRRRRSCRCARPAGPRPAPGTRARSRAARIMLLQRRGAPRRTWPPPAAPTCRGRAGGRSRGARGSRRPPPARASAWASVPVRARRRMHHHARRLVDHHQVLVLEHDLERHASPRVRARRLAARPRPRRSPAASRWLFGRGRPSTVTAPGSISRWAAARDADRAVRPPGTRRAARPRPPRAAVSSSRLVALPLRHVQEPEHPERRCSCRRG